MTGADFSSRAGRKATVRQKTMSRGLALLAVLWVLTLLALMAVTVTQTTRTEVNLARNAMERFRAEALADAGIHLAAARLQQAIAEGGWSIDGRVRSLDLEGGEVRILIADEAGKIDLNGADVALLQALFRALGTGDAMAVSLADAIVDFRDGDRLNRPSGGEDEDYRAAGLAHDAKDAPFEDVAELQQVMGITPELYARAAPLFTVHTRNRRPNEAAAPPLVLAALHGETLGEGGATAEADAPMGQGGVLPADLDGDEDASEAGEPSGRRSQLGLYALHAEGRTEDGAVFARDAVVQLVRDQTPPFRTLAWQQGRRHLFPAATSGASPEENGD